MRADEPADEPRDAEPFADDERVADEGAFELEPRLWPIGLARTPFADKASAPRQPAAARGVEGRIELVRGRGLEHATEGLEAFDHVWLVFGFHLARGHWRPKVRPPRSTEKRGVLATRSPHRPNGLGLSVVRLVRVEPLVLHVLDVDLVDGTPVYDIKPYLPYCDAIPEASSGWLEAPRDPGPTHEVVWSAEAARQRAFIEEHGGGDVGLGADTILAAGPEPHPYRRIRRRDGGGLTLAVKAWRFVFEVDGARVTIAAIASGYRPDALAALEGDEGALHRAFVEGGVGGTSR